MSHADTNGIPLDLHEPNGGRVCKKTLIASGIILAVAIGCSLVNIYFLQEPDEILNSDPCCHYPCLNQGVCVLLRDPDNYMCDCTGTGYYGAHCDTPEFGTWVSNLKPGAEFTHLFLTSNGWFWDVINSIDVIRDQMSARLYLSLSDTSDSPPTFDSDHHFVTADVYFNTSLYARALPPVPRHCPTPMGTKGPKILPAIDTLIKRIFSRKTFIADPHDSNLLFQYYAHHFSRQFIQDTKIGHQVVKGVGEMDVSHIYGLDEHGRQTLKSGLNGKLRSQVLSGEEFPPYWKDVPDSNASQRDKNQTFALTDSSFSMLPGLFVFSTIWLREHNRVCDELLKVHSDWDDDRLYETARIIVTGEVIKITLVEYLQHFSQYKLDLTFNPELIQRTQFQFHNRIHAEFNHLFDWHPFVPDHLLVNKAKYSLKELSSPLKPIFQEGFDKFIHSMIDTPAGAVTAANHGQSLYPFLKEALESSRQLRFQGINAYRKRFGLRPFSSFEDLTGEEEVAAILKTLYDDIDAVEYYVGLLVERPGPSVPGMTMMNMAGVWTIKSVLSNPICSLLYWKSSTFGGHVGWNIVQEASLEKLFCRNMRTGCRDISFHVPS